MIDEIKFGVIKVDGKTYDSDIIIYPNNEITPWWRKEGMRVQLDDLSKAIALKPKRIIIANGLYRMLSVSPNIRLAIEEKEIHLEIYQTLQAVDEYNKLPDKNEVVFAVHIRD